MQRSDRVERTTLPRKSEDVRRSRSTPTPPTRHHSLRKVAVKLWVAMPGISESSAHTNHMRNECLRHVGRLRLDAPDHGLRELALALANSLREDTKRGLNNYPPGRKRKSLPLHEADCEDSQ